MNRLPPKGSQFLAEIIDEDFTVSFVTYIEFLGYKSIPKATEEFMALAGVIEIDKDIKLKNKSHPPNDRWLNQYQCTVELAAATFPFC